KSPHFPARAQRVVHLFMNGGPSHVDTFDPKPLLAKYHGKPLPSPNLRTERKTAGPLPPPFTFPPYRPSRPAPPAPFPPPPLPPPRHRRPGGPSALPPPRLCPRRRPLRPPLGGRPGAQPRAVAHAHEHRRRPPDAPQRRRLGHLRPGLRQPEPPRLPRPVPP